MQIAVKERKVQRFGVKEEGSFSIAATAQAFKILSDGLYSNKIRAIVRELSCNAHDAHVAAGSTDQFEVHLASIIEPWFAVRDWGIGLSHDDVMHLYTTYFESTKANSNDFTGCLGLGSKSPFSYTDQFTITSIHEGMKRLYSAFIGEAGNPQITLMNEEDTDEGNGIEVKVTVKSDDFSRFSNETRDVLSRFNPAPRIVGADGVEIKAIDYSVIGNGWAMRKEFGHSAGKAVAVQGNVAYPIDGHATTGLTNDEQLVLGLPIDIQFDLGDLMITASRETLSYGDSDPTGDSIKRKCAVILAELPTSYQKEFDDCKTLWEAKIKFRELMSSAPYSIRELIRKSDKFKITWKGEELTDSSFTLSVEDFCDPTSKARLLELISFERRSRGYSSKGHPRGYKQDGGYDARWKIEPYEKTAIFFDDIGRGSNSRVVHYMEDQLEGQREGLFVIKSDDPKMVTKFVEALGNPKIRNVSELPKPTRTSQVRKPGVKVHKYIGNNYADRDCWESTEEDLDVGGIYVPINRCKAVMTNEPVDKDKFARILARAKELGLFDWETTPVYGVYPRYAKKLAGKSNWVSLWDHLTAQLDDVVKNEKLDEVMAAQESCAAFQTLPGLIDNAGVITSADLSLVSSTSEFVAFVELYRQMAKTRQNDRVECVRKLARLLFHELNKTANDVDLDGEWSKVTAKYPMLKLLGDYYGARNIDCCAHIIDYVNLVDAA